MTESEPTAPLPTADWLEQESAHGVRLRSIGAGLPVFVFPGMEGSGESCLHLARPAVRRAGDAGAESVELVLVDFSAEAHDTFEQLAETCLGLVRRHLRHRQAETCLLWGQSFGNLLAATVAAVGDFDVAGCTFVSPFTRLPGWKATGGTLSMVVTPTPLYRATIGPLGRYVFGPCGDGEEHPFFDGLRRMTSAQVRRRTGWLRGRDFAGRFERVTAPTRVWLGERDRLVAIEAQTRFFVALADERPDWQVTTLPGSGHVVLDSTQAEGLVAQLAPWIGECVERAGALPTAVLRPSPRVAAPFRRAGERHASDRPRGAAAPEAERP